MVWYDLGGSLVARPGRKPINLGMLNLWEFEWYKAFHLLRDGSQLPHDSKIETVDRRVALRELEWWKKAKPQQILGDMRPGNPPPFTEYATTAERVRAKQQWIKREWAHLKEWAKLERQGEIADLERQLRPRKIHALAERRQIWNALIEARTESAVKQACQRWKALADVRAMGMTPFPDHLETNFQEFLRMKKDSRFPHSAYADESRLEFLARGMAGVMVSVSPMTAEARLRNMKHGPGGPIWNEHQKICGCWRCQNARYAEYIEAVGRSFEASEEKEPKR